MSFFDGRVSDTPADIVPTCRTRQGAAAPSDAL